MVEPAPAHRRAGWLVPVLAVVVIAALLLVLVAGYFIGGVVAAANEDKQAAATLESARKHNNQIYDALKTPKLPSSLSSASDIGKARQAFSSYLTTLTDADKTLDSDLKSLSDEDSRLKADQGNLLLLPERSRLAADRERVSGMVSAFTNAKTAFKILRDQIPVLQAFVDVIEGFDALAPFVDKEDWQGALNALNQLSPKLQTLVTAASGPNVPPDFTNGVKLIKQLADDFKSFLQAVVGNDLATARSLSPKLDADIKALDQFDPSGIEAYEDNLLKPYKDAYEGGMKKAGFTVTG
jgi:soluble cytochrome b562